MDNITEGSPGMLEWGCGNSPNPCMKVLKDLTLVCVHFICNRSISKTFSIVKFWTRLNRLLSAILRVHVTKQT